MIKRTPKEELETIQSLNVGALTMAPIPRHKDWLTLGKVAEYCLVSRATIRRWVKTGTLKATRLPSGHYRVNVADLRDFLKQHDMPIGSELIESKPGEGSNNTTVERDET